LILCRTTDRLQPEDKKNLAQKIDSAVFPECKADHWIHVIAAKAVALHEASQPDFVTYQEQY
jgi:glycine hydroxymethyltransferase